MPRAKGRRRAAAIAAAAFVAATLATVAFVASSAGRSGAGAAEPGRGAEAPRAVGVAFEAEASEDAGSPASVSAGISRLAEAYDGLADIRIAASGQRGEDGDRLIRSLAESGCGLVIAVGPLLSECAARVALGFPAIRFACVGVGPRMAAAPANTLEIDFALYEGSFLAGALAALSAERGGKAGARLGFVGGIDDAAAHAALAGFASGAAYASPAFREPGAVSSAFGASSRAALADPLLAAAVAAVQLRAGAEISYQDKGGYGPDLLVTAGPSGMILAALLRRLDAAVYEIGKEYLETGALTGGRRSLGLAGGYVELVRKEFAAGEPPSFGDRIEGLRGKIAAGEILVPKGDAEAAAFVAAIRNP